MRARLRMRRGVGGLTGVRPLTGAGSPRGCEDGGETPRRNLHKNLATVRTYARFLTFHASHRHFALQYLAQLR